MLQHILLNLSHTKIKTILYYNDSEVAALNIKYITGTQPLKPNHCAIEAIIQGQLLKNCFGEYFYAFGEIH